MRLLDREKLKQNIEEIALFDLENNNLFGSSYFVYQKGEVLFKRHFGNADFEGKKPVDDSTIYRIASMTKPITAIGLLVLVDRGLVSLDDPISKYIPEFADIHIIKNDGRDLGKPKNPATVFHCMTHTSGFGSEKNIEMTDEDRETNLTLIRCYAKGGLDYEPFSRQSYSSYAAFDVLAAISEQVTGQDFEEFLKKEIFIPCNMTDTTFSPTENQWERVITMHCKVEGKSCIGRTFPGCVFRKFPCKHKLAGAGLVSTLDDYSSFAKMLLSKGKINGTQIISEKLFERFSSPCVPEEIMPKNERWGLGVRVITKEEYRYLPVGSFGWSGAFGSHFWVDPENDICTVFMKNSQFDGGAANRSARRFEEAVFNALI